MQDSETDRISKCLGLLVIQKQAKVKTRQAYENISKKDQCEEQKFGWKAGDHAGKVKRAEQMAAKLRLKHNRQCGNVLMGK